MKKALHTLVVLLLVFFAACTGSKKYFKAAERLEKQGLVNEAAEFYFQSLQRKPTNVEARIKLKEVGQKYTSSLASEFFRNFNTQQLEPSLESFERMKDFVDRSAALNVQLDYPKAYEEDYHKTKETYCLKNYNQAAVLVNQKKYSEALGYIKKVKRYNPNFKNTPQLEVVAICEPLYQNAINNLESKNYGNALQALSSISAKTDNYKDSKDLLEMASAQHNKTFILFEPTNSGTGLEKEIAGNLYSNFSQAALDKSANAKIINNSPFQNTPSSMDFTKSTNVDMIQAIRKATGADYFYFYTISNAKQSNTGLSKKQFTGYQEVKTRKNDTLVITEYNPFNYTLVKAQESFSYDFNFKLINAYSNQIVASQQKNIVSSDAVEYQEFVRAFKGNINTLYPYNPLQTSAIGQYNPKSWRGLFSARKDLKSMDELKTDVSNQNIKFFTSTLAGMK